MTHPIAHTHTHARTRHGVVSQLAISAVSTENTHELTNGCYHWHLPVSTPTTKHMGGVRDVPIPIYKYTNYLTSTDTISHRGEEAFSFLTCLSPERSDILAPGMAAERMYYSP